MKHFLCLDWFCTEAHFDTKINATSKWLSLALFILQGYEMLKILKVLPVG